jgi:glucose dehydrogenase
MRLSIISGTILAALLMQTAGAQNDWPSYGHDPGANRYSTLSQITPANVSKLTQAWTFSARPSPDAKKNNYVSKTTPLLINGVMYFTTPFQSLVAVEPETGKTLWSFDHKYNPRASRGISYWAGDKTHPPTIFFGTEDGLLIAINAKTGKKVPGFANEGELDLKPGMKDDYPKTLYGLNGAAAVYKNLVITGSHV